MLRLAHSTQLFPQRIDINQLAFRILIFPEPPTVERFLTSYRDTGYGWTVIVFPIVPDTGIDTDPGLVLLALVAGINNLALGEIAVEWTFFFGFSFCSYHFLLYSLFLW